MKLSEAIAGYWLANRGRLSKNTQRNYDYVLRRLCSSLGDTDIGDITPADIRKHLEDIEHSRGLSKRSLSDTWIVLSSLWTWAAKELGVPQVVRSVPRPRYDQQPIIPLTLEEVQALVSAAEWGAPWVTRRGKQARSKRPTAKRDKAIILVLLDTGVRASELCDLQIRDYEPDSGQLYVRHGKGNKRRVVYLGQRARLHLWRYMADRMNTRPADPLFASRTNTRLDRTNLRHMLNAIAAQAKVNNVHPHRFRHTFAITFLRNGGNTFALQKLLGHSELSTVLKYVRLAETDIRQAQAAASVVDNWRL
jgi:integrase/recombinase XerD